MPSAAMLVREACTCGDVEMLCVQLRHAGRGALDDFAGTMLTPLHLALVGGHENCVRALLDARAQPALSSGFGFAPLAMACSVGYVRCMRVLLEHSSVRAEPEHLALACMEGHVECARLLISGTRRGALAKPGVDVDAPYDDVSRETALMVACQALPPVHSPLGCVRLLLRAQADVNAADHAGLTALHRACQRGHVRIVRELVRAGARLLEQWSPMGTPLLCAAHAGSAACVRLLLRAHASATERGGPRAARFFHGDVTPLHVATRYGDLACMRALLAASAEPWEADVCEGLGARSGVTALEYACLSAAQGMAVAMAVADDEAAPLPPARALDALLPKARLLCAHATCTDECHSQRLLALAHRIEMHLGAPSRKHPLVAHLRRVASWDSRLQHVAWLRRDEVIAELRRGGHADGIGGNQARPRSARELVGLDRRAPTALELAREALAEDPYHAAARVLISASEPWSPRTHHLLPARERARALELLLLGHEIAAAHMSRGAGGGGHAGFVDVWVSHVMPRAVFRLTGYAAAQRLRKRTPREQAAVSAHLKRFIRPAGTAVAFGYRVPQRERAGPAASSSTDAAASAPATPRTLRGAQPGARPNLKTASAPRTSGSAARPSLASTR